ncbi:MAG: sigma-70 family RNA polymerase sigma factor [Opitutales bacterium]|nr:sigma-70 family RNA polymerase sigma factor [Opitutales bacterium]
MSSTDTNQTHTFVELAQSGDQEAFGELVKLHHSQIYGQILRMVRNSEDAQEIAQLTWIKVWNKIDSFRFESAFSSWLYRVATFTALDAIRKRNSRRELSYENPEESGDAIQHSPISVVAPPEQIRNLENQEIRDRFKEALNKLPEHHRTALMLRETEGLNYKEIAQKTGCKTGTVMSRIFNARKAIQTDMKDFLS